MSIKTCNARVFQKSALKVSESKGTTENFMESLGMLGKNPRECLEVKGNIRECFGVPAKVWKSQGILGSNRNVRKSQVM